MSILIRTGSGKTDLSYTENAVKNLKVLQKTGTKSVQWITTQAGTTYNNILQKRGVKDLFYGNITIPSDIPAWVANPESGSPVNIGFTNTQGTLTSVKNKFAQSSEYNRAWGIIDCKDSKGFIGNAGFKTPYNEATINNRYLGMPVIISFIRLGDWGTIAPDISAFPNIRKLFVVDTNNPNRKFVALLERDLSVHNDSVNKVINRADSGGLYSYTHAGYRIRDSYNTIDNFMDGNTYKTGLRMSDY